MSILELPSTQAEFWTAPVPIARSEPLPVRWSRAEFYRLAELGFFNGQRVELIDGEIIQLPPQSPEHFWCVDLLMNLLSKVFSPNEDYWVRAQGPVSAGPKSETEPDISVVRGKDDYRSVHPKTAVLMAEVSLSSLNYDRMTKGNLYASIGVLDYWVLDVANRRLEVRRKPVVDEAQQFGWRYDDMQTIDAAGTISPLEKPETKLAVADMLPPVTA